MEFLVSTNFWSVLLKVLLTALLSTAIGAMCTLIGKLLVKFNDSKLIKHAKIAVRAAEQKFPNEGKKMGPEKMDYVMDYLAITFPKIKSNQYLYNIAEAAVYELNGEKAKKEARQIFKDKYGKLPDEEFIQEEKSELDVNIQDNIIEKSNKDTSIDLINTTSNVNTLKSF